MSEYAHEMLMNMVTAAVAGTDLTEVLESLAGQDLAVETLIEGLRPVMGRMLQLGLGLGGRMVAGTTGFGEAEEQLRSGGRDLLAELMQAVVDAAGAAERHHHGGVAGPDGVQRTRVEDGHARDVATVFGSITVRRKAYRAPGTRNVHPLDEVLDLPEGRYSPGLARLCVQEGVRGSFADAGDAIEYATGVRIGTRQIIELVRASAADATGFYTDPDRKVPPADPGDALVITGDGKGVPGPRPGHAPRHRRTRGQGQGISPRHRWHRQEAPQADGRAGLRV